MAEHTDVTEPHHPIFSKQIVCTTVGQAWLEATVCGLNYTDVVLTLTEFTVS